MKGNSWLKKNLMCIINGERNKYIWNRSVVSRVLLPAIVIQLLLAFVLGIDYENIKDVILDVLIKTVILIPVGYCYGVISFSMYKKLLDKCKWDKKTIGMYIFTEGILGWGILCGILISDLSALTIRSTLINLLIWCVAGVVFGILMRFQVDINIIRKTVKDCNNQSNREKNKS